MRVTLGVTLAALLLATSAFAKPVASLTLVPAGGTVFGSPGTVVGWGYDISNFDPSAWLVLNDSFVSGSLASGTFGTYVDYVASGFTVIGPGSDSGMVAFSQGAAGLGEFDLVPFVPIGTQIPGNLNVDFSVFSQDPNSPTFDPGSFLFSGTMSAAAEVDAVPEPGTLLLFSSALLPFAFLLRRRRRS